MNNKDTYVQIVYFGNEKVMRQFGPHSSDKADKIELGIQINLNHEEYYTRQVLSGSELVVKETCRGILS